MVTNDDVFEYVGLEAEYADAVQTRRIEGCLNAAVYWLKGAVAENVNLDDPRAEELVLMAAGELYENRALTDDRLSKYAGSKALASLNRLAGDMLLQLKLNGCISDEASEDAEPEPETEPNGDAEGEGGDGE